MIHREEDAVKAILVSGLCIVACIGLSPVMAAEDYWPAGYTGDELGYWDDQASTARSERMYSPTPRRPGTPSLSMRPDNTATSSALPTERTVLAVDVDETLSVTDYNSLLWGIGKDDSQPLPGAQTTLSRLGRSFEIIYVTARSRSLEDETRAWLAKHGFPSGRIVTSPTLGDFIFQGDFKRKVMQRLRSENPNLVVGIGDKAKDGEAYRNSRMVSVIVNPWRNQKYHADDIVLRDWSAVADFFEANQALLSNPRRLKEGLNGGRLSLNLSSEAREYQGQS